MKRCKLCSTKWPDYVLDEGGDCPTCHDDPELAELYLKIVER